PIKSSLNARRNRAKVSHNARPRTSRLRYPRSPVMRARLSGASLGVVFVSLAVVVPTEELEVVEVGRSAAAPVRDVMRLAAARRSVATGVLAVLVAYDERFPLRRSRGRRGAADVEDFGAARDDRAADVAIAQQPVQ